MTDESKPGRRPYRRTSARRRGRFLAALEASGNVCEAAAATGFARATIYKLRRQDAGFAAAMEAAVAAADAGLAAEAEQAKEGTPTLSRKNTKSPGGGLVIRRGRGGRTQLVAAGKHWWDGRADAVFLAYFRASGNVRLSARAAGFSAKAAHERRARSARFARDWEDAAEEAEIRLEWRLLEEAKRPPALAGGEQAALEAEAEAAAEKAFEPWLGLWLLKRRHRLRDGRWKRRWRRPPTIERVTAQILRKIAALRRYKERFGKD